MFFVRKLGYSIICQIEILPQRLQLEADLKSQMTFEVLLVV